MDAQTTNELTKSLFNFQTITLAETKNVRLMRRTDTKYVIAVSRLPELLEMLKNDYLVQLNLINERFAPYGTTYFDTPDFTMFYRHTRRHDVRDKVRIREYMDCHEKFLEVKHKDNHGKTHKRRVALAEKNTMSLPYADDLKPQLSNSFHRITLVSKSMNERITIDTDIAFHNLTTEIDKSLPQLAVIELKRDGLVPSVAHNLFITNHIHPLGFSKYCIGSAMTNPSLRINNIKEKLNVLTKICRN